MGDGVPCYGALEIVGLLLLLLQFFCLLAEHRPVWATGNNHSDKCLLLIYLLISFATCNDYSPVNTFLCFPYFYHEHIKLWPTFNSIPKGY